MKKYLVLSIVLLFSLAGMACDFCNCYLGLNPHYKKNSLSLRHSITNYKGTHHDLGEFSDVGLKDEDFLETRTVTELHGQIYLTPKIQLILNIPYMTSHESMSEAAEMAMSNHSHGHDGTAGETMHGIGDPLIIGHYQLFNKVGMDSTSFAQRLFAGGGLKFPVGSYKLGPNADPSEAAHKPGTGSWDFLISASYLAKMHKAGLNINASYMLTTMNNEDFQFGNRFNVNAIVYYQCKLQHNYLFPGIGIFLEQAAEDWSRRSYMRNSGGEILYAHAGLDFYYRRLSFNLAYQMPIKQSLNQPQPELSRRMIAGIAVALN
ncbi:MAG TPA: hypothetical protein PKM97_13080 [Bacteroidia bacterium]|nr:hypothetical protein [Bacteroidia bacterium]